MRKAHNKEDFKKLLREQSIYTIFRQNEQGRIYGVTFLDYENRAVMNGSRLGKEFSANVFNDLFNNPNRQINEDNRSSISDIPRQAEKAHQIHQTTSSDSILGTTLNLLDIPIQNDDYEEENFTNRHKSQMKKAKKQGRRL